jgi:hypothetical protein
VPLRRCATESNSSKNSRHGRFRSAVSNALSMFCADPPCSELTRSPVETWMKFSPYSPGDRLREEGLADAGRPVSRMPFHSMP